MIFEKKKYRDGSQNLSFSEAIASTESAFGLEDGSIPNAQITASSYYSVFFGLFTTLRPYEGRLNDAKYWATEGSNPTDPWIQVVVSLLEHVTITAIQIQGGTDSSNPEWVTTLQIQTGYSESSLSYIMNGNVAAVSFNASPVKLSV